MIIVSDNIINVRGLAGSGLYDTVKEALAFCIKYRCEVRLTFNSESHTITRFTKTNELAKLWFE